MITSIFIRDPWHVNVKMPYKTIKEKKAWKRVRKLGEN
jgi:hypothetical protein